MHCSDVGNIARRPCVWRQPGRGVRSLWERDSQGQLQCSQLPSCRHLHLVLQQLTHLHPPPLLHLPVQSGREQDQLHPALSHGLRDPPLLGNQHGRQSEDKPTLRLPHHSNRSNLRTSRQLWQGRYHLWIRNGLLKFSPTLSVYPDWMDIVQDTNTI